SPCPRQRTFWHRGRRSFSRARQHRCGRSRRPARGSPWFRWPSRSRASAPSCLRQMGYRLIRMGCHPKRAQAWRAVRRGPYVSLCVVVVAIREDGLSSWMVVEVIELASVRYTGFGLVQGCQCLTVLLVESTELLLHWFAPAVAIPTISGGDTR